MSHVEDKSFDYDYDGIQEYDNPLPRWWVWLFIGTIAFAAAYIPYYHFGPGQLPRAAWQSDMDEWLKLHPPVPLPTEEQLVDLEANPSVIERGKSIFAVRCTSCHGVDGGGLIGPNLTDDYSIHGYSRATIAKVVNDGVPAKGMLAWGQQLSRDDVLAAALYAYQLRGKKPANPKAPQGDLITDGSRHASADTP